jgi:hypothetical protein
MIIFGRYRYVTELLFSCIFDFLCKKMGNQRMICCCLPNSKRKRKSLRGFSKKDRLLIQNFYEFKGYVDKRLIEEFPLKRWKLHGQNYLLERLHKTGSMDRLSGSGRPDKVITRIKRTQFFLDHSKLKVHIHFIKALTKLQIS